MNVFHLNVFFFHFNSGVVCYFKIIALVFRYYIVFQVGRKAEIAIFVFIMNRCYLLRSFVYRMSCFSKCKSFIYTSNEEHMNAGEFKKIKLKLGNF